MRVVLLALALMAGLAGCAQPAHPAAAPVVAPTAVEPARDLDFAQTDCESMTWTVPVTAASLRPYLPAGFEPAPPAGQAGLDGAATLGFRAIECASGFGEPTLVRSQQSGQLFTSVLPPPDLREDRFDSHYLYVWDALVAADAWRASAMGWGLPLHDGGSLVGPTAQGWTGAVAMDQVGSFTLTGRTQDATNTHGDLEERLITVGANGFALWDAEVADLTTSTGIGVWNVNPESWVATVLGGTQGVASFQFATFDLPTAFVHWPGQDVGPVDGNDGGGFHPQPPLGIPA